MKEDSSKIQNLKPIETLYKGYRFRSRLEARWAVFFDALGIQWYYEHEGFDVTYREGMNCISLGYYLPDFYLPHFQTYIEIKPITPKKSELDLVRGLSCILGWGKDWSTREISLNQLYEIEVPIPGAVAGIFHGLPCEHPGQFYIADCTDSSGGEGWWDVQWGLFEDMPWKLFANHGEPPTGWPLKEEAITLDVEDIRQDRELLTCGWQPLQHFRKVPRFIGPIDMWPIILAMRKARSARFEYGEVGK